MKLFEYRRGTIPLVVSIPHSGVWIPGEIEQKLTDTGKRIKDTDWFLERLYDVGELAEASTVVSRVSRYVVDLNRSQADAKLYPGKNTTGLCPLKTFAGENIYLEGVEPDDVEIQSRVATYWEPYHRQLRSEIEHLVARFGFAILLDAHSIASELPWLFDGRLQDFNFGTDRGKTCEPTLQQTIESFCQGIEGYTAVVNGRFVGGFITRNYGQMENVNAVQLELSQRTYLNERELSWTEPAAAEVQPVIRSFIQTLRRWNEHP